jgi:hypothetical protein
MLRSLVFIPLLTIGLAMPAIAQQKTELPKSGSLKLHTGFKVIGEPTQIIKDKHSYNTERAWGVSYNDAGSGPLHISSMICTSVSEAIEGAGTDQGKCAWSDADGDKLFIDWSGKFTPTTGLAGMIAIASGSGKFTGIQGKGLFQCMGVNVDQGQYSCTQQLDYQLSSELTGTSTPPATTPSK